MPALNEIYDLSELESIRAGTAPMTVDEELDLNKEKHGSKESWDETSLLLVLEGHCFAWHVRVLTMCTCALACILSL